MSARRANPVKIGAFVVGGAAILVVAILMIGSGRIFRRTHPFVAYFEGSVHGLRAGASVKFKGVELGKVSRIRIPYWLARTDPPIAVFFSLDADKVEDVGEPAASWVDAMHGAIREGLRAQLESDSIVTGILHVALIFDPESEARFHEPMPRVIEIPTVPQPLREIGAAVQSIVDRVSRYDVEALLDSMKRSFDGVSEVTHAPELRSILSSLDRTLIDLDDLVVQLRGRIDPLADELTALARRVDALGGELQGTAGSGRALLEELLATVPPLATSLLETSERLQALTSSVEGTLDSARILLGQDAPIPVELRAGLRELADTARAARVLFELIERDPAVLLRGKGVSGGVAR